MKDFSNQKYIDPFNPNQFGEIKNALKSYSQIAIGEIAGRDSFAAIFKAAQENSFQKILPTIGILPTESGNWNDIYQNHIYLKEELDKRYNIELLEPIAIGSRLTWAALCGRFSSELIKNFGFYTPCLGCHLYLHLLRAPLALHTDTKIIITGERSDHEGKIKINQVDEVLSAYIKLFLEYGLYLQLPIRNISNNSEIENILKIKWEAEDKQFYCVFSGNYLDSAGQNNIKINELHPYLEKFLIPVGAKLLEAVVKEKTFDPFDIVNEVVKYNVK